STAYSASSRPSAARPPTRMRSYGWSSASSSWRRPRASPPRSASGGSHSPTCHSSSRRVSPKPSHPPTHTRCSMAVRLSLGGARRTMSPTLRNGPPRVRSVTTAVAVSSLQSRMNPSPTRTPPASCPPSPAFHRPLPRPSTVHHTSLTFTSGSRISIPFRLPRREPRERLAHLQHLVLVEDHPQSLREDFLQERVVHRRPVATSPGCGAALLLAPPHVRVHRAAYDRPGSHDRDFDREILEIARPGADAHPADVLRHVAREPCDLLRQLAQLLPPRSVLPSLEARKLVQLVRQTARPPVRQFGDLLDLALRQIQRLADLAHGGAEPVGGERADEPDVLVAVPFVDPADQLLADL